MKNFNEKPNFSSEEINKLVDNFEESDQPQKAEEELDSLSELSKDQALTGVGQEQEIDQGVSDLERRVQEKLKEKESMSDKAGEIGTPPPIPKKDKNIEENNDGVEFLDAEIIDDDSDKNKKSVVPPPIPKKEVVPPPIPKKEKNKEEKGDVPSLDELIAMTSTKDNKSEQVGEKVESKMVESPVSQLGEKIEAFENDMMVAEGHLASMYDQEDRENFENIEDAIALNPKENLVALGDGMGGVGEGDKAAQIFSKLFESVSFGELAGLSEQEVKKQVFDKLKNLSERIDEGMITCTMVKFFKDKEGNNKAIALNVGDGGLYHKDNEGKVSELIEAASPWSMLSEMSGSIIDNPDGWATALNGMMRNFQYHYPNLPDYLEKMSQDPNMQSLKNSFDFHKVLQYVENDSNLDDSSKKKIFKLFKNINRQSLGAFNVKEGNKEGITPFTQEDVKIIDVQKGDKFFLASDGITDNLNDQQIAKLMDEDFTNPSGREKIKNYVDNNIKDKEYFKPDDMSYVPIEVKG